MKELCQLYNSLLYNDLTNILSIKFGNKFENRTFE